MTTANLLSALALVASTGAAGCGTSGLPLDFQAGFDDGRGSGRAGSGASLGSGGATSRGSSAGSAAVAGSGARTGLPAGSGGAGTVTRVRDAGLPDAQIPTGVFPDAGRMSPVEQRMPDAPSCPGGTYTGDLTLVTRADIERLRGCTRIAGNLIITTSSLSDLKGLEALAVIDGTLRITPDPAMTISLAPRSSAPSLLKSLVGLEGLQTIQGLQLEDLSLVTSLQSFSNLRSAQLVIIWHLDGLNDLHGLEGVTWTSAIIAENAGLSTLEGLSGPTSVQQFVLYANPKLEKLGTWPQLHDVSALWLVNLPLLKDLSGFHSLQSVNQIGIDMCNALVDLTGLEGVQSSAGLLLQGNQQLRTLKGLAPKGGVGSVQVVDSPLLDTLAAVVGPGTSGSSAISLIGLPLLKTLGDLKALEGASLLQLRTCDGLTDLTGLDHLRTVDRLDILDCANLQSLQGAPALETVGTSLTIDSVPALQNLQGLNQLRTIGLLGVSHTSKLPALDGLENVVSISGLQIVGNLALTSLHGIKQVKGVSDLQVEDNPVLQTLDDLPSMYSYDNVTLNMNTTLKTLAGLSTVHSIGQLTIDNSPGLVDLAGLEQLSSAQEVVIDSNAALTSLRALSALGKLSKLEITDNRRLPQCEIDWLSKRTQVSVPLNQNGPQGMCAP